MFLLENFCHIYLRFRKNAHNSSNPREEVSIMDVEKIYDLLLKLYCEQEKIKVEYRIVKVPSKDKA